MPARTLGDPLWASWERGCSDRTPPARPPTRLHQSVTRARKAAATVVGSACPWGQRVLHWAPSSGTLG